MKLRNSHMFLGLSLILSLAPASVFASADTDTSALVPSSDNVISADSAQDSENLHDIPYTEAKITELYNTSGISISPDNFPDDTFREYVAQYDTDADGILNETELSAVTTIDCSEKQITSLEGIEYFSSLVSLDCKFNCLTSLDVSKNTALEILDCSEITELVSLNISNNSALTELYCSYTLELASLDVSNNPALTVLDCRNSWIDSLDVSNNLALTTLYCSRNQLTSIDVSNNSALTSLDCSSNQLTSIDISRNSALTSLDCSSNHLTSIDVSNNSSLIALDCSSNQLASIDVSNNSALTSLDCSANQLTSVDVSNNSALRIFYCSNNPLTSLDVSSNLALTGLYCNDTQLTSLDISNNLALTALYCANNPLTSIDISKNIALDSLWCFNNQLTELDTSNNPDLFLLSCSANQFTSLDLSQNTKLGVFSCDSYGYAFMNLNNNTLDLSALPGNFDVSKASNWNGATINGNILSFEENTSRITFDYDCGQYKLSHFSLIPTRTMVTIDKNNFPDDKFRTWVSFRDTNCDGILDEHELAKVTRISIGNWFAHDYTTTLTSLKGIEFFSSLSYLDCRFNQLTSLDVSKNTALTHLYCAYNGLTSIDISQNTALIEFFCNDNQLESIDTSKNTVLTNLDCDNNPLISIDISKNLALTDFSCSNTKLNFIDTSKNTALERLYCSKSFLSSLDLSQNTALTWLSSDENQYNISISLTDRTFDLTTLPGKFDVSRASSWVGGTVNGNILTVDADADEVTYSYACDQNRSVIFTLKIANNSQAQSDYKVLNGANSQWNAGSKEGLAIRGNGDLSKFTGVKVDDTLIDSENYTVKEGSTIVTLKPEYLSTLSGGKHTFRILWKDGFVNTNFTVNTNPSAANTTEGFVTRLYKNVLSRDPDNSGLNAWVDVLKKGKNGGEEVAKGFIFSTEYINKKTSNDAFVEMLYNTLLNRKSDANGRKAWVNLLNNGSETREGIVEGFIHSDEFTSICEAYGIYPTAAEAFAARLYTKCLGRDYDKAGLKEWANLLHNRSIGGGEAAKGFFLSPEFLNKNLSDHEFVTRCYRTFLSREPDASGLRNWVQLLKDGHSREEILDGFIGSDEYGELCISYNINR